MWSALGLLALAVRVAAAGADLRRWEDGSDLESFISVRRLSTLLQSTWLTQVVQRPDIKAPRMMVSKHRPDLISDGYWFATPYSHFDGQSRSRRNEFKPCQTGAHIYDGDGVCFAYPKVFGIPTDRVEPSLEWCVLGREPKHLRI
jgi:hypothetical protein